MKNQFCPLCDQRLVYEPNIIHCPVIAYLPNGKQMYHYNTSYYSKWASYYLIPYRITTHQVDGKWLSKIEEYYKHSHYFDKYKSSEIKFLVEVPEMHPDTDEKMRKRLKTLLLLS